MLNQHYLDLIGTGACEILRLMKGSTHAWRSSPLLGCVLYAQIKRFFIAMQQHGFTTKVFAIMRNFTDPSEFSY